MRFEASTEDGYTYIVTSGHSFLDIINHIFSVEKISREAQWGSNKPARRAVEFCGSKWGYKRRGICPGEGVSKVRLAKHIRHHYRLLRMAIKAQVLLAMLVS